MANDFSMYLDADRKNGRYMIRDSFTQEIRYHIPEWLMKATNTNICGVANRFMWIDNDTVKIVSEEGIERLVDLKNNFKEIEFNRIPLYDPARSTDNHYYIEPTLPETMDYDEVNPNVTFDTYERLKRKYQYYKSAYYIDKKRDPQALY
jgi:hypothetical protein